MRAFRPKLGPTIATLIVFPLLMSLGFWQLDRADEKRQSATAFSQGQLLPPSEITQAFTSDKQSFFWNRVTGTGVYQPISILLDNRIRNGRAGYEVLTPLETSDGTLVLVDRGWLPASADRTELPAIEQVLYPAPYQGNLGPPPASGISINEHGGAIESLNENVYRVQKIELDILAQKLSIPFINGVLYLSNESPHGYARDWPKPGFNPQKHEAYATQWFVMAVIVAGLFIVLNVKKNPPDNIDRENI